jgi:hypothetical protein
VVLKDDDWKKEMKDEIIFPDEPLKIGDKFYLPYPYSNLVTFSGEIMYMIISDWNKEFGFTGFQKC